jgi:hypothetical protein
VPTNAGIRTCPGPFSTSDRSVPCYGFVRRSSRGLVADHQSAVADRPEPSVARPRVQHLLLRATPPLWGGGGSRGAPSPAALERKAHTALSGGATALGRRGRPRLLPAPPETSRVWDRDSPRVQGEAPLAGGERVTSKPRPPSKGPPALTDHEGRPTGQSASPISSLRPVTM